MKKFVTPLIDIFLISTYKNECWRAKAERELLTTIWWSTALFFVSLFLWLFGSDKKRTWHWTIFPGGYPPSIFAATTFHSRVRDGSKWFHCAHSTRKCREDFATAAWLFWFYLAPAAVLPSRLHKFWIVIFITLTTKNSVPTGQALGLLARLGYKHCCSST